MRILVTGASGLVGGRLIQYLLGADNVQIRAASRSVRTWPDGVEGCVADVGRPPTLQEACRGVDVVINLSSMAERMCALDPMEALRVNGGGTLALAIAAANAGVRRFVQLSTYKVYGSNPSGRLAEETLCRPQSHYAITHHVAELYAASQHSNCVILRLANGFGAPANPNVRCWDILTNEFCRQAAVDGRIRVRSSGLAWRNIVPMSDVVRALHAAAVDLPADTYNLGRSESLTLRDLAARVARVCEETFGSYPSITCGAPAPGEAHLPLDYRIDRLAAAGFEPGASIDGELSLTLRLARDTFGKEPAA
jgi:UDP-glucose 4-epimerase